MLDNDSPKHAFVEGPSQISAHPKPDIVCYRPNCIAKCNWVVRISDASEYIPMLVYFLASIGCVIFEPEI